MIEILDKDIKFGHNPWRELRADRFINETDINFDRWMVRISNDDYAEYYIADSDSFRIAFEKEQLWYKLNET